MVKSCKTMLNPQIWKHYIDLVSKSSLYSNRKRYYTVLQWKQLLNPTLTSLEEVIWALFIQKIGDPSQGAQIPRRQTTAAEGESINADLKLKWASTEPTCQSGGWFSWHTNPQTNTSIHKASRRAHTCGGEREGEIPHKGCWSSTLDLSRSPPSIKDLLDPVILVQIWPISIKSAENPLI